MARHALDKILCQHLIDPTLLRADDFEGFFADRKARLAVLAGEAMGRAVVETTAVEPSLVPAPPLTLDEREQLEADA